MADENHTVAERPGVALLSEILILPDGRVLGHSLTPVFTRMLSELNPDDPQLTPRRDPASAPLPPALPKSSP